MRKMCPKLTPSGTHPALPCVLSLAVLLTAFTAARADVIDAASPEYPFPRFTPFMDSRIGINNSFDECGGQTPIFQQLEANPVSPFTDSLTHSAPGNACRGGGDGSVEISYQREVTDGNLDAQLSVQTLLETAAVAVPIEELGIVSCAPGTGGVTYIFSIEFLVRDQPADFAFQMSSILHLQQGVVACAEYAGGFVNALYDLSLKIGTEIGGDVLYGEIDSQSRFESFEFPGNITGCDDCTKSGSTIVEGQLDFPVDACMTRTLQPGQYLLHIRLDLNNNWATQVASDTTFDIAVGNLPQSKTICRAVGACCLPSGECASLTEDECIAQSGDYKGNGTACETVNCQCELSWAAPVSGELDEPSNWSPEVVPADDGNGCQDILLDVPGEYEIIYGSGAAADSLSVLQGQPMLSGGTLALSGEDNVALNVEGGGALSLGSGSIHADTALISGSGAAFHLLPGTTLSVTTALETGRESNESATLDLNGGEAGSTLSVAGSAALGNGGSSLVSGAGKLSFLILGDLGLAALPGSNCQMALGGPSENPAGAVEFAVGETFTVGRGGSATATLQGPLFGDLGALRLGRLEGAFGSLLLDDGVFFEVRGEVEVGMEGTGKLKITGHSALEAESVLVSGPVPDAGNKAVEASSLIVDTGSRLTVTTFIEAGRNTLESGEIELGGSCFLCGGNDPTIVEVAGNVVLGSGGSGTLRGGGPLSFGALGDLSMAVLPGSDALLVLQDSASGGPGAPTNPVEFTVNGAMTIGGAGNAKARLSGAVSGEAGSLSVGLVEQGRGELALFDGASLNLQDEARVGVEGTGVVEVHSASTWSMESLKLSAPADAEDVGIRVNGEQSLMEVRTLAEIGEGPAQLQVSEAGRMTAQDITVDGVAGEGVATLTLSGDLEAKPSRADVEFTLTVGNQKAGQLNMDGSTLLTAEFMAFGVAPGSTGFANLVGDPDLGDLENVNAVKVKARQFMLVGQGGIGDYKTSGVSTNEFGTLILGVEPSSSGFYTAVGIFSDTKVAGDLIVGSAGSGNLALNGGNILADVCVVGALPGSFGIVRLFNAGRLLVGIPPDAEGEFEGDLEAEEAEGERKAGPKLDSISIKGFLQIGRQANGLLELFDPITRVVCEAAFIGGDNAAAGGTLGVDTGATFESKSIVTLGGGAGPALVRVADRANMILGTTLIIGPKGLFIAGGGSNVSAPNVVVDGRLRVVDGLSIERPPGEFKGAPAPKGDGGPAIIDGDLEVGPDGVLEVTAGAGEALVVTGAATLDGTLEITLQPGATFTDGQLLDLIDFQGGSTGDFASVVFLNAPEGFEGDVEFADGKLRLRVVTGGTADPEGEGEGQANAVHVADQDGDQRISLSELLRVIQFYNALGLHCAVGASEDGYIAGADDTAEQCSPHDSDFDPQDWSIILSELLQLIQLYNADGYEVCDSPEGFCPILISI